eukprot:8811635-Pyramimonas_sp.AAC.1
MEFGSVGQRPPGCVLGCLGMPLGGLFYTDLETSWGGSWGPLRALLDAARGFYGHLEGPIGA